ncbi:hypothetical protein [Cribrihabitans pelagius]
MEVDLNDCQMKRAADKDASGGRKLPYFVDPIDGMLRIGIVAELALEA